MPKLFPARPTMDEAFAGMPPEQRDFFLLQNASLQAGYLILAARALGLDCGPMAGFDREKVDAAFFADVPWKSILFINLGHGRSGEALPAQPPPRFRRGLPYRVAGGAPGSFDLHDPWQVRCELLCSPRRSAAAPALHGAFA